MKTSLVETHDLLLEVRTRGGSPGEVYRYWKEEGQISKGKCYFLGSDEKILLPIRDYLELLDVHETDAGYVHGVYNVSERMWKTLQNYRKLIEMEPFPDLETIEDNGERIEKVEDSLDGLERAKRN